MRFKIFIILFFLISIQTSCYDDVVIKDNIELIHKDHPKINTDATLIGAITDEKGKLLKEFTSSVGDQQYSTEDSYYHFDVVNVNKNATHIDIMKNDTKYDFTVKPIQEEINYFRHTIFTHYEKYFKPSNEDLNIQIDGNNSIKINAKAYRQAGAIFTGTISPDIYVPNLQNPIHSLALPGGHLGIRKNDDDIWLDYYGAIYIDIQSVNGTSLDLIEGQSSVVLDADNCNDCLLWKYNEHINIWEIYDEKLFDNKVEFSFTQSGYYLAAKPYAYNLIDGTVQSGEIKMKNQAVDIYQNDRFIERVFTTNSGKWFAHLPFDASFDIVIKKECFGAETFQIRTEKEDIQLAIFEYNEGDFSFINIKGKVKNCERNDQEQHFLKVWLDDDLSYLFLDRSNINLDLLHCASDYIRIQSVDENWQNIGPIFEYGASNSHINFNNEYTCDSFNEGYFIVNFDGVEKELLLSHSIERPEGTILSFYDNNNGKFELNLQFAGNEVRSYQDDEVNISFENLEINNEQYNLSCSTSKIGCGFKSFNISNYENKKKGWIKGEFEARFWVRSKEKNTALYKNMKASFLVRKSF